LGKCIIYGEKHALEHQCNMEKIHMIKGVEGDSKEFLDVEENNSNEITTKKDKVSLVAILDKKIMKKGNQVVVIRLI